MFEELKEFGLSENEISVYVTLIKTGLETANRISKITGMKRSTTYDNLSLLQNKGLVSTIMKDGVGFYRAADPTKITLLLDERRDKIVSIVPRLESLQKKSMTKTGVTFFEGKKGVITVLNDILDERKELWFYGSRKMALTALQNYPEDFIQKRADHGIRLKAVLAMEDYGDPSFEVKNVKKLSSLKHSKELDRIETNVFIYSDRVAFMTSGENLVGIIIRNNEIVQQQKQIFMSLWNSEKK